MESVNNHWQERIYFNSDGNNKTKQLRTAGNVCLQKKSMTTY